MSRHGMPLLGSCSERLVGWGGEGFETTNKPRSGRVRFRLGAKGWEG